MAGKKIVQTAGRQALGSFALEFAHLNDDILFGEVWSRNDLLSLRDRSLVTIVCLIAQARVSLKNRERERHHAKGNRRDSDACGLLCGVA